ncbi:MAG: VCBS repeat-containing protein [Acidobacteriales bacterium]|nr:VCBS repeat-containing protein [Terriglobales bacterium]
MRSIFLILVPFLTFLAGVPASATGFKLKSLIPIDAGARSVAVADLNHDGNMDLAVASEESNSTVSVLLGKGNGSFQPQMRYPVGSFPYGVAAADVNLDGYVDLVVTNEAAATMSVLLGNGDGTFQAQRVSPTQDQPFQVAVGDFNGDGIPDAVTASIPVGLSLGNGDGTFQSPINIYAVGGYSIGLGDFDADGNLDLAIGTNLGSAGSVQILLGQGDGTFKTGGAYSLQVATAFSLAVGDLNHDGKLDIVATTFDPGVDVLLGNGDGTFTAPAVYPMTCSSYGITIADFNRDGNPDLAAGDFCVPSLVSVFTGNGNGTFQPAMEYSAEGNSAVAVVALDLNNDGSPDLVVASNGASSPLAVLINTGGTLMRTTSSANPSKVGQKVTFTTQVKQSVPGTGTPSGTVKVKDGTKVLGTANLVNGKASFSTSTLAQGTHRILGSYSGDANFNPNSAEPLVQVVNP